jgi:hypothetical protein
MFWRKKRKDNVVSMQGRLKERKEAEANFDLEKARSDEWKKQFEYQISQKFKGGPKSVYYFYNKNTSISSTISVVVAADSHYNLPRESLRTLQSTNSRGDTLHKYEGCIVAVIEGYFLYENQRFTLLPISPPEEVVSQ